MSVNLNDLNKYNEATMYNSVNVQPTTQSEQARLVRKTDNVETPATSEVVSNDKKSETKLDKPAVSVAQESQKKENVTETSEYEKLQGDITSYNNDDKTLKQIREDLRSLMSNEGTKEDKAKLSENIQENIKKLENVSKEDKATMSENIDSVISNNTNSLKDSIKEMTSFLKNFNSKEVPSFLQNIDYAKESSSFNKNSLNNLQGSFASVQSYLTQDLVSKLLR